MVLVGAEIRHNCVCKTIGFNPDQGYNPSLRHFQGSNFLFIDGHVKFLTFAQYYANRGTTTQPGLLNAGIQ